MSLRQRETGGERERGKERERERKRKCVCERESECMRVHACACMCLWECVCIPQQLVTVFIEIAHVVVVVARGLPKFQILKIQPLFFSWSGEDPASSLD